MLWLSVYSTRKNSTTNVNVKKDSIKRRFIQDLFFLLVRWKRSSIKPIRINENTLKCIHLDGTFLCWNLQSKQILRTCGINLCVVWNVSGSVEDFFKLSVVGTLLSWDGDFNSFCHFSKGLVVLCAKFSWN